MLDHIIQLVDERSRPIPMLSSSPLPNRRARIPLVKVAHTWIGADMIDKALEE
jgi:hypothetical protein